MIEIVIMKIPFLAVLVVPFGIIVWDMFSARLIAKYRPRFDLVLEKDKDYKVFYTVTVPKKPKDKVWVQVENCDSGLKILVYFDNPHAVPIQFAPGDIVSLQYHDHKPCLQRVLSKRTSERPPLARMQVHI